MKHAAREISKTPQMLILQNPCQYNPEVNPVKVRLNVAVPENYTIR